MADVTTVSAAFDITFRVAFNHILGPTVGCTFFLHTLEDVYTK